MNQPLSMGIRGTGRYVPAGLLTNRDLESYFETSDEWITTRTGVKERRMVSAAENTLTMAIRAARDALEDAGLSASDLDLIICSTVTPAYPLPSTANMLADALGAPQVPGFDVAAACAGFVYAVCLAATQVHAGAQSNVLVVGAETMTRLADREDRASYILFGDGAGAAVLSTATRPDQQMLYFNMGADGSQAKLIWVPAGGSAEPASTKTVNERLHVMKMKGREVYKFAVTRMQEEIRTALQATGLTIDDVTLVVPHQSNLRIIESARDRLGIPAEKVFVNIERLGNTSSASVAIALDEAREAKRIGPGNVVLITAIGAGLVWSTAMIRL